MGYGESGKAAAKRRKPKAKPADVARATPEALAEAERLVRLARARLEAKAKAEQEAKQRALAVALEKLAKGNAARAARLEAEAEGVVRTGKPGRPRKVDQRRHVHAYLSEAEALALDRLARRLFADNRSAAVAASVQLAQAVYQYARTGDPAGALAEFVAYMRGQREGHLSAPPEPGTAPAVAAVDLAAVVGWQEIATPGTARVARPSDDAPTLEPDAERREG